MEPKIVFTGPPGAGKTTAIAALSDTAPIVTDVVNHDAGLAKARTTVGMDYGSVALDDGSQVRLFGTPGQERFEFLWPILVKDALGLAILIDNSRADPLADLRVFLHSLAPELPKLSCVVGIGRLQTHARPSLDDYADAMAAAGWVFPVLPVDVRQREDVLMLVEMMLAQAQARTLENNP
jgi:signal recognition particle receptor subunit beta